MKPRLFHAFKIERAIKAIHKATSRGEHVLVVSNEETTGMDRFDEKLKCYEEKLDLSKVIPLTYDLYSESGLEEVLTYLLTPEDAVWVNCEGSNPPDEWDPKQASTRLLILLDHGNRTPHLATLLAKTNITVISATPWRVKLKDSTDEENAKWGSVDTNYLYGKPSIPDFSKLTDAQHARFVRDDTRNLDALFPVYDLEAKTIDHHDVLTANIPQRTPLLILDGVPMLFSESITEMFAWRGTGKTVFALGLGYHLAAGKDFLGMSIPSAAKVLYVEGELPAGQLKERMKQLSSGLDIPKGNFTMFSKSLQQRDRDQAPVTIKTEEGRLAVEAKIAEHDATVVIFDSITSLAKISTNNEDNWIPITEWFVDLRCKGICVIYLQQSGKNFEQRGHSASEDPIDLAMKLTKTGGNPGSAAFDITFPKVREEGHLKPLRVRCTAGVWERDSSLIIKSAKAKKPTKDELIREALNHGEPHEQIAKRLKTSTKTITKIKKELQNADPATATNDDPRPANECHGGEDHLRA
jgi:KaiC/GvpD/RAD55 family RecA-like ATPase